MLSFNSLQFIKNLSAFGIDFRYGNKLIRVDYELKTCFFKFYTSKIQVDCDFTCVFSISERELKSSYDGIFELFACL